MPDILPDPIPPDTMEDHLPDTLGEYLPDPIPPDIFREILRDTMPPDILPDILLEPIPPDILPDTQASSIAPAPPRGEKRGDSDPAPPWEEKRGDGGYYAAVPNVDPGGQRPEVIGTLWKTGKPHRRRSYRSNRGHFKKSNNYKILVMGPCPQMKTETGQRTFVPVRFISCE